MKASVVHQGDVWRDGAVRGDVFVLDIRMPDEFAAGHIPGSTNVPLKDIKHRLDDIRERAARHRVAIVCQTWIRSKVIHDKLEPGDGGLIAVSRSGEIALPFSSEGMFRGAADSGGRLQVAIWDEAGDLEPTKR